MARYFGNGYASVISTGPIAGATTVVPTSVAGAPATPFDARIRNSVLTADGLHFVLEEIVSVTDITTGTCTITRATEAIYDGTQSAVNFSGGAAVIEAVLTAGAGADFGGAAGGTIIVKDEGGALTTAADTLDFVGAGVVASGTGTTKTITVAGGGGGGGDTDSPPASPNASDVEFASALGTWSDVGTFTTFNITDSPGALHLRKNGTGGFTLTAKLAATPSMPFFMWWKVPEMILWNANYQQAGVILAAAGTAGPFFTCAALATSNNYGYGIWSSPTTRSTWGGDQLKGQRYLYQGIYVASTTDLTTYVSVDGHVWRSVDVNVNPGFTITQFGPYVSGSDNSVDADGLISYIRFRSTVVAP